jgi:hypothetical protein
MEIKKKIPNEDLRIIVKYTLFNEPNKEELIEKYRKIEKKI